MSILKNLRKKAETLDMKKAHQVIAQINKLIEMKILEVDLGTRKFSLEASLWNGKDQVFKNNWCKSIALYWEAITGMESKDDEKFSIFDISTGEQVAFYSRKNGCYNAYQAGRMKSMEKIEFDRA
jgi:hypothetical protein